MPRQIRQSKAQRGTPGHHDGDILLLTLSGGIVIRQPNFLVYDKIQRPECSATAVNLIKSTISHCQSGAMYSSMKYLGTIVEIVIVTGPPNHDYIEHLLHPLSSPHLQIVRAPISNKRAQLCIGFLNATAPVLLIADDDTVWSPTVLSALSAPLERLPHLGAVFSEVQLASSGHSRTVGEELAVSRLFGDAVDSRASQVLDGGVLCASGPAAAVRASIVQDDRFQSYFRTEEWRGVGLNAGDDQALTRWLCGKNWDVMVLPDDDWGGCSGSVRVDKRSRPTWRHIWQLLRWSRSDWQANIRALLVKRVIWRRHPFTALTRLA
ncbi:hypothetical protein BDR22DRAFT_893832 [Usnea florida]